MICLWGFLLLAVATNSVDSQICSCSCAQNKAVTDTFTEQTSIITKTKPDSKLDLGLVSSLLNLVKSLSNLAFLDVNVTNGGVRNITTGWGIGVELSIRASCLEINSFNIKVNISVNLDLKVKNGASYWELLEDTLTITASIDGTQLILSGSIVKAVADTVLKVLKSVIKSILNICVEKLNNANKLAIGAFSIGKDTTCKHEITKLTKLDGNVVAEIITKIGNILHVWGAVGEIKLNANEFHSWNIGAGLVKAVLDAALKLVNTKIYVPKELLSSHPWAKQYTDLSVQITVKLLKTCELTDNGAELDLTLVVTLLDGSNIVAAAEGDVNVTARPQYKRGHLSLSIISQISSAISIPVSKTFVDPKCGCDSTIASFLTNILKVNLNLLYKDINCHTDKSVPLPAAVGTPGPKGQCVSKKGVCRCSAEK